MMRLVDFLYEAETHIDVAFNLLGSVPFVNEASGPVRMGYGKIQAAAGAVLIGIGVSGWAISSDKRYWNRVATSGAEHIAHGVLNGVTGLIESVTGPLFCVLKLLGHHLTGDQFLPFFAYGTICKPSLSPLMT